MKNAAVSHRLHEGERTTTVTLTFSPGELGCAGIGAAECVALNLALAHVINQAPNSPAAFSRAWKVLTAAGATPDAQLGRWLVGLVMLRFEEDRGFRVAVHELSALWLGGGP